MVQVQVDLLRSGGCAWLINDDHFGATSFFKSLIVCLVTVIRLFPPVIDVTS